MRTGFLYDALFLDHRMPAGHPESAKRLAAITRAIGECPDMAERLVSIPVRPATKDEVTAVHSPAYFTTIMNSAPGYLDSDTYLSPGTKDAALNAAGAVCAAVEACRDGLVDGAFCAVRPPGHHAERSTAMGFCIFNNVAVGAAVARTSGYDRVFIVDFDVHHGNGTEHMFYDRGDVFYFSTHQSPHYPGTGRTGDRGRGAGEGTTYNMPLPANSGDVEFARIYSEILPRLVRDFGPSIMLVSAGYDIRDEDPLSSLEVTNDGIRTIVDGILSAAPGVPVVFTLEGGYDLDALAESVVTTLDAMLCSSR